MKNKVRIFFTIISSIIFILAQFSNVNATAKNNNPMLKDIKINGYSIEPKFEMFTTEYVLTVEEEVDKVEIEAIPDDEKARVEIKGNTTLEFGRNEIEIQVTAENGQAKQSYFLYITKGYSSQANANLKEIKIENIELAPIFDKNTINYAFEYPKSLEQLKIEALPEDEDAKVEIVGNENLKEVTQNIEIQVTAKDGQTIKTYYLTAKKAGIEVENPEGNEPPREETKQEKQTKETEDANTTLYMIIVIIAIVIIIIAIKSVTERRKKKYEK